MARKITILNVDLMSQDEENSLIDYLEFKNIEYHEEDYEEQPPQEIIDDLRRKEEQEAIIELEDRNKTKHGLTMHEDDGEEQEGQHGIKCNHPKQITDYNGEPADYCEKCDETYTKRR